MKVQSFSFAQNQRALIDKYSKYNYKSKFVSKKYVSSKVTVARSNTKYYVKIRTYKTVDGVKYYSGWSAKKSFVSK